MSSVGVIRQAIPTKDSWVERALEQAKERQDRMKLPDDVRARISEARQVWNKLLFPTAKLEEWKYTNPEAIANGPFVLADQRDEKAASSLVVKATIPGLDEVARLVFIDGVFSESLSKIATVDGVTISRLSVSPLSASLMGSLGGHRDEAFAALATALFSDAVCVEVSRGKIVAGAIHVIHVASAASKDAVLTPRILVEASESSMVSVVESYVGASEIRYLSLPVVELRAHNGARIDYYKIQTESCAAYHVSNTIAEQRRDGEVRTHLFSFGGALARNNAQTLLSGENSRTTLNGLSLLSSKQHVDNTTLIHHIEPSAESREHFKGIYADESRGVFSGTITVEKIAQKTNAFQSNQALLLSTDASIDSRPQLKIWADDVKCTHGATVGQLDKDALFYLQSRGVGKEEAKAFLVHAFASEVLSSVLVAPVKERVEALITERLSSIATA